MHYIPYNSRNTLHKYPFGSVKELQKVTFKVVLPRNINCSGVSLVIESDYETKKFPFFWLSMQGDDEEWWCLDYIPKEKGLFFYHFEYYTPYGISHIYHDGSCLGSLNSGDKKWQLTVYSSVFNTPDWLKGGIIYQIFPDRFYKSGKVKKDVPSDRKMRYDWGGEPEWKPNSDGKVLNNDYFGGDLKGIEEKLSYLKSLSVSCIYLNPIFEAQSNHRYDTADYSKIDTVLGDESDFKSLCEKAQKYGISIILDGVFSHTGDDSIYFNKYGRYKSIGAYNSKESPYYNWYKFSDWPNKYSSWWGIDILPEVTEENDDFLEFITGKNGIARKWLKLGAKGWRLDVADELPDAFLDAFRTAVKDEQEDALILGEVWEDASNKCSYSQRRRYLQGAQLDSVMNYPFAQAVVSFVRSGHPEGFTDKIMTVLENYPKCVVDVLMNHIGTHDTMRAITQLAGESCEYRDRSWQSKNKLSCEQYEKGVKLMKIASAVLYMLPGVPSIYYGDEAGMEGYKDPFNRGCYPWGKENKELVNWYKSLGKIRNEAHCLKEGAFHTVSEMLGCLAFTRSSDVDELFIIANRNEHKIDYYLPESWHNAKCVLSGKMLNGKVLVEANEVVILKKEHKNE